MVHQDVQLPPVLPTQDLNTITMDDHADHIESPTVPRDDTMALASPDAENEDDLMLDDTTPEGPARIYTPPPHIAARFYRSSSQARRKSSAASSRRNSISSNHSRSSHGYGPPSDTPQSKHVAQHLRRASILADRKARLADRAAHAEQVRLRAAQAKAAVRDMSQSEERAQAAAQAREKKLEEIAAACADEVKRAKAIAESIKEKREQEHARLRQQIQDRLDEAERRRDEMRRNSGGRVRARGQSVVHGRKPVEVMPEVDEDKETSPQASPGADPDTEDTEDTEHNERPSAGRDTALTPEEAAYKILHWWRKAHRQRVVAEFLDLKLSVESVQTTSFETMVEVLSCDKVVKATGKVLRLCGIRDGKASSVKEIVVTRTFLGAYMILGHPTHVLSEKPEGAAGAEAAASPASTASTAGAHTGPLGAGTIDDLSNPKVQDLMSKAKDLLICFDSLLQRLTQTAAFSVSTPSALSEAYDSFSDAFMSWKARSASAMIDLMVMQFVELDAIWQTVKDGSDPSVSETYRTSIRENQLQLMVRIKRLAGADRGRTLVFDAVAKARRAKAEAKKTSAANASAKNKLRPRGTDTSLETAMGELGTDDAAESAKSATTTTNSTNAATSASSSGLTSSFAAAAKSGSSDEDVVRLLLRLNEDTPDTPDPPKATLPDTRFGGLEAKQTNNPLPENRVVLHELCIDPGWRCSPEKFQAQQAGKLAPYFEFMRGTMHATGAMEQGVHFNNFCVIARLVRERMESITNPQSRLLTEIRELMDTTVLAQQFERGRLSYDGLCATIAHILGKMCAPFRDEALQQIVATTLQSGNHVDALEALVSFMHLMVADHANFSLVVTGPRLLTQATAYEYKHFKKLVGQPYSMDALTGLAVDEQLPAAARAWRAARARVVAEAAQRDPEGVHHPRARPSVNHVYTQMLVDVFMQLGPVPYAAVPEMLRLDYARVLASGAAARRVVAAGAVLLQCKTLLKRDVRMPWKTEAARVMAVLSKADDDFERHRAMMREAHDDASTNPDLAEALAESAPVQARRIYTSAQVVDGVVAALESGRSMPPATKAQLRSIVQRTIVASAEPVVARARLRLDGTDAVTPTTDTDAPVLQEPVLRLLAHRLRGYLAGRLAVTATTDRARQQGADAERLAGLGLAEFAEQVRELVHTVTRVSAVDRDMHAPFWEAVDEHVRETAQ